MDYYKITNEQECHIGMSYKTGLNTDIIPFNPRGDCCSGGIYFASSDILFFLPYGVWLRKVTLPEGEKIYKNPSIPEKWKAHQVILGERERITGDTIKRLVSEGAFVNGDMLTWACRDGIEDRALALIEVGAPVNARDGKPLTMACRMGLEKVVIALLAAGADVHKATDALAEACRRGHREIVDILIKAGANLNEPNGLPLILAYHSGLKSVVGALLKSGASVDRAVDGVGCDCAHHAALKRQIADLKNWIPKE